MERRLAQERIDRCLYLSDRVWIGRLHPEQSECIKRIVRPVHLITGSYRFTRPKACQQVAELCLVHSFLCPNLVQACEQGLNLRRRPARLIRREAAKSLGDLVLTRNWHTS